MVAKISKIFGIINITPDSYSDGGKNIDHKTALISVEKMIRSGVDVIDIGAESTRPGGDSVDIQEEIYRLSLIPDIRKTISGTGVKLSLDSRNYETIRNYIDDIDIINDVTGLSDKRIRELALSHNKTVVLMHSLFIPAIKGSVIQESDVVGYLKKWFDQKLQGLYSEGFVKDKVILDIGLGFGPSPEQSMEIIKQIKEFMSFGLRVLVGHSRKSFLAQFGEKEASNRDPETHLLTAYLANAGVHYLRLHDVDAGVRVMKLNKKLKEGIDGLVTSLA
jgi:dihydropteroate synthase